MRKNIFIAFLLIIILSLGLRLGFTENKNKSNDQLYKLVELFSDTLAVIQKEYVDETKIKDLIYGSLKGMLSSLDPHSQFMDPDTYNELKVDTQGKFGGIGIEITLKNGILTVITPIEDTPAWKAGIKANDSIVKINDELTRDMTLTDAVKRLRGKPLDPVNITVLRENENKLLEFKIVRDIIKIKDIKYAMILESGVGYIRLTEFRENSTQELNNALSNLSKQGVKALIIDLRNNPGGLLDEAVKVTSRFLERNKLVAYTEGRQKDKELKFYADSRNPILDMPLAVLINEGSASGSEIVAGALQDYKRAIIIGTKSFGKGSVQTVIPLSDGSALRLTTSHYFTPSGKIIHGKGVVPDIEVILKERDEKENESEEKKSIPKPEKESFDYKEDEQVVRALNVLEAIIFYKQSDKIR
ncbi:MAG: S41 family peptidase [Candidatus Omnitrophica bacterium]|nr:S41 family peptidase [Candidatus Omnitrophota bacterium]